MRHRQAGRHLARTTAHRTAMFRNMAQSLFQYGQIETTIIKAKEVRPFVERLITVARRGTLHARQRVVMLLGDRAMIEAEDQEKYDALSSAQRRKVMVSRSGRRHRAGKVPASYNKKKVPFVAHSIVNKLMTEIAPRYGDRPGGYTRIIRLSKRRIGDDSELALLQLIGDQPAPPSGAKKPVGHRRRKTEARIRFLEGKAGSKKKQRSEAQSAKTGADGGASSAEGSAGEPIGT